MQKKFKTRAIFAVRAYKELIDNNTAEAENLDACILVLGVSRNTLQNGFKTSYGMGTREYKLKVKMELAQQMLAAGKDVKEIAITLRYNNSSNFSAAFKRFYGVTPTGLDAACKTI
jgi:AraC-like DNA-binding protein